MAKTAAKSADSNPPKREGPPKPTTAESIRETVDSIVIAFVLAFLFRTFEAEAFVIPTGSMALTLMGDHKDLNCSRCGYPYRCSASSESPNNSHDDQEAFKQAPTQWEMRNTVVSAVCPNCRYRMHFDHELPGSAEHPPDIPMPPSYKGDRILVTKYSYEFSEPQRWDVAVFKNPNQAKINYIKRIVGLPNEQVMIYRGDIYVRDGADRPFRMARKPHDKFTAVAQTVYDNDYVLPWLYERGWPQRWVPTPTESAQWKQSDDMKTFHADAAPGAHWLRYQHYVPNSIDWAVLQDEQLSPELRNRLKPQLITDFCEYNSDWTRNRGRRDYGYLGWHWVADIGVECELTFGERTSDEAEAVLEIIEGGVPYRCHIRAATGDIRLAIGDNAEFHPTAKGAAAGAGPHRVRFANVDDQLLVWINDEPVTFDADTTFQTVTRINAEDDEGNDVVLEFAEDGAIPPLANLVPTSQDLKSPVGIAAVDCGLNAAHLRIMRDVYYIADRLRRGVEGPMHDYTERLINNFRSELDRRNLQVSGEPDRYAHLMTAMMSDIEVFPTRFEKTRFAIFPLAEDQFFVLGDNSPRSSDARLWSEDEQFVRRELLIGKALFVYWPHALDKIPGTGIPFPIFPNFGRMRMIR